MLQNYCVFFARSAWSVGIQGVLNPFVCLHVITLTLMNRLQLYVVLWICTKMCQISLVFVLCGPIHEAQIQCHQSVKNSSS